MTLPDINWIWGAFPEDDTDDKVPDNHGTTTQVAKILEGLLDLKNMHDNNAEDYPLYYKYYGHCNELSIKLG